MTMKSTLEAELRRTEEQDGIRAVILTGTGDYYSAGVDLGGTLPLGHPRRLRAEIIKQNRALFELFIRYPKPILVAVNGHAIGAPVTSATLCNQVIASDRATFSTPFAKVGLPAEGCSSVIFPRLIGATSAARMLGEEGWKPCANEALAIGLIDAVVPHRQLMDEAQRRAESWIASGQTRSYPAGASREELERINAEESERVADGFLSADFLMNQYRFLRSRKKTLPALTFLALRMARPVWSLLL